MSSNSGDNSSNAASAKRLMVRWNRRLRINERQHARLGPSAHRCNLQYVLGLLAARLTEAGQVDESLAATWRALRTSEIVPTDDARRLARLVMEAPVAMPDQACARAEHQRLVDYLEDGGLDVPEALQERLRPAASGSDIGRGNRVAVADD